MPVEQVPSVAELRARQAAATTEAVRAALDADDLHRFSGMVDELAGAAEVRDVARAALKVAHEARTSESDEVEIPAFVPRTRSARARAGRAGEPRRAVPGKPGGRFQGPGPKTRLFISLGRRDRIRPGDLVGAIANESDLTGKDIGPINVADNFSTVDVPAAAADAVIAAIKQTTIRGKRAIDPPRPPPRLTVRDGPVLNPRRSGPPSA